MVDRRVIDTLIAEAGGNPDGLAAVAAVINNRSSQWGLTPFQVVSQRNQFEGYSNPGSASRRAQQDPRVRALAEQVWSGVTGGSIPDPTSGGVSFRTAGHTGGMPSPNGTVNIGGNVFALGENSAVAAIDAAAPEARPANALAYAEGRGNAAPAQPQMQLPQDAMYGINRLGKARTPWVGTWPSAKPADFTSAPVGNPIDPRTQDMLTPSRLAASGVARSGTGIPGAASLGPLGTLGAGGGTGAPTMGTGSTTLAGLGGLSAGGTAGNPTMGVGGASINRPAVTAIQVTPSGNTINANPPLPRSPGASAMGMVAPGNIDLTNRPVYFGNDGTYGTERSFSIGTDHGEVLLPQIVNGKLVSQQQAIGHYRQTGENLGTFTTPDAADAYAVQLHQRDQGLGNLPVPMSRPSSLSAPNVSRGTLLASGAGNVGGGLSGSANLSAPSGDLQTALNRYAADRAATRVASLSPTPSVSGAPGQGTSGFGNASLMPAVYSGGGPGAPAFGSGSSSLRPSNVSAEGLTIRPVSTVSIDPATGLPKNAASVLQSALDSYAAKRAIGAAGTTRTTSQTAATVPMPPGVVPQSVQRAFSTMGLSASGMGQSGLGQVGVASLSAPPRVSQPYIPQASGTTIANKDASQLPSMAYNDVPPDTPAQQAITTYTTKPVQTLNPAYTAWQSRAIGEDVKETHGKVNIQAPAPPKYITTTVKVPVSTPAQSTPRFSKGVLPPLPKIGNGVLAALTGMVNQNSAAKGLLGLVPGLGSMPSAPAPFFANSAPAGSPIALASSGSNGGLQNGGVFGAGMQLPNSMNNSRWLTGY